MMMANSRAHGISNRRTPTLHSVIIRALLQDTSAILSRELFTGYTTQRHRGRHSSRASNAYTTVSRPTNIRQTSPRRKYGRRSRILCKNPRQAHIKPRNNDDRSKRSACYRGRLSDELNRRIRNVANMSFLLLGS